MLAWKRNKMPLPKLKPISEQVMVITGASSGIGLATARTAAKSGAKVVLAARSGHVLEKIVRELIAAGREAVAIVADVGDRQQVEKVALHALERFDRIDTWVNNAGVSIYGKLEEVPDDDSRRLFDTNFWGVVYGSLAALPCLKVSRGALINVGSELSDAVTPSQGMYAASKHAVKGFNDALRVELEIDQAPVSVTLIQSTAVNTPFPQNARSYTDKEPRLPSPLLDPQEVADAIIDAATTPRRYVKVGALSKLNSMIAKLAPGVGDRLSINQATRQHLEETPRNPKGCLYSPSERGRIRGSGIAG